MQKNFTPMPVTQFRQMKKGLARRKPQQRESHLQQACIKFFRLKYPMFRNCLFSIPNEARRSARNGARMKAMGMLAGVPDLFLAVPREEEVGKGFRGGLFIELKAGKNKPTNLQRIMIEQLRVHLYEVVVCHSLKEFESAVKKYFDFVEV